ncbi:MAG: WHG domain-containing protein [Microbacteriaceae bacterium]|nr:WHG domain-containing protein [Microbacteriaceae bacterium]
MGLLHHFGTREQLLTALATEGFAALTDVLDAHPADIKAMGNAYVAWALAHPGHYAVMWQPRLVDESSPELTGARQRAWTLLSSALAAASTAESPIAHEADTYAAFAIVHGLASIWLSGTLTPPTDPATLTALITERLTVASC